MQSEKEGLKLKEAINNFLFHCQYEKNLSGKTLNAYRTDLFQFVVYINSTFNKNSIDDLGKEELKSYLQKISGYKPKTVKRKMASLKAMYNFLEYESDDFINPLRKIKIRLKEPSTLPTVNELSLGHGILYIFCLKFHLVFCLYFFKDAFV